MKVLVIGSGGRENALSWKLAESKKVTKVYFASGTKGMSEDGKIIHLNELASNDYEGLASFAQKEKIDLTVVGPDQALADGCVDIFQKKKLRVFGPTQAAAQAEASKDFAKEVMVGANIPTAEYKSFTNASEAILFIDSVEWSGVVVKKDGLALGKGVVVCESKEQAQTVARDFLESEDCDKIIVEELLVGREVSYFCLCDGKTFYTLGHACDYKRIRDNDEGPNTGGMGAYCPADWLSEMQQEEIEQRVIQPFIYEMEKRNAVFKGTLFVGFIMTENGPKVLEFNVRFGDPETQAMLPLLDEDLFEILMNCCDGKAERRRCKLKPGTAIHLVTAAHGYPGTEGIPVRKGDEIKIKQDELCGAKVFYAGVKKDGDKLFTNGGRVLGLTQVAKDRETAIKMIYQSVKGVSFQEMQFRGDIGK